MTGEPFIRFYAGAPLIAASGLVIGTICVIDTVPRSGGLDAGQIAAIEALARQVMTLLDQRRLIVLHDERASELREQVAERKIAQAALEISDDRYRSLFNSLDAGFCVIEMAFNKDGSPRDYRFVEVNEAFVEQTGLHDATGKWMRDLAPDHEAYWFEIYGKVALTGEPVRFEHEATALDHRWYDVRAFRIGPRAARQVAILFNDITVRRNAEQQQVMLNEELGHRMKNSMALVQAIASQTLRGAGDRVAVQAFNQPSQRSAGPTTFCCSKAGRRQSSPMSCWAPSAPTPIRRASAVGAPRSALNRRLRFRFPCCCTNLLPTPSNTDRSACPTASSG